MFYRKIGYIIAPQPAAELPGWEWGNSAEIWFGSQVGLEYTKHTKPIIGQNMTKPWTILNLYQMTWGKRRGKKTSIDVCCNREAESETYQATRSNISGFKKLGHFPTRKLRPERPIEPRASSKVGLYLLSNRSISIMCPTNIHSIGWILSISVILMMV